MKLLESELWFGFTFIESHSLNHVSVQFFHLKYFLKENISAYIFCLIVPIIIVNHIVSVNT